MTREPEDLALEDARALVDASSRFVELTAARKEAEACVLLLARRLTRDWRLTDEEAVRAAGALAVRMLLASRPGGGHGG